MKRYRLLLAALFCGLTLVSCGNGEDSSIESKSDSSVSSEDPSASEFSEISSASESSTLSTGSSSEISSEPVDENGEHDVTLCNGTGQDITALRIRSGSGEEDYWSFEILAGSVWQEGTAISLTLREEEWTFTSAWEMEVTLADGTVMVYDALPLSDVSMLELLPERYNSAE